MNKKSPFNNLVLFLKNKGDETRRKKLFLEIWEHYYPGLILYIHSFAGLKNEADDHAQEIFTKVFLSLDSYNPFYSFSTWFYGIARHYCIDVMRKNIVQMKKDTQIKVIIQNEQLSPESILLQKEQIKILKEFIAMIPQREKQVLILRYSENLKYREIADVLGMNGSTVRSIVRKLKIDCKKYMEKAYER